MKFNESLWNFHSQAMGDGLDRVVGWGEVSATQREISTEIIDFNNIKTILEIGFNRGASALMWLLNDINFLYSIDIDGSLNSVNYLKEQFGKGHFEFKRIDSKLLRHEDINRNFDMVFIDGDHSANGCYNDIVKSLMFQPKYILFDDYFHADHSKDIFSAISYFPHIKISKEYKQHSGWGLYTNNYKYIL